MYVMNTDYDVGLPEILFMAGIMLFLYGACDLNTDWKKKGICERTIASFICLALGGAMTILGVAMNCYPMLG